MNAGNSRSTGISQLRAGKTLSKKARSHFLSQRRFSPMYTGLSSFYGPSQYFSSYLSWRLKSKKIHFSRISIASCKKNSSACCGVNFKLSKVNFPRQTVDFRREHIIHIWKAYANASVVNLSYLETIFVHMHPTRRKSFASKLRSTSRNI